MAQARKRSGSRSAHCWQDFYGLDACVACDIKLSTSMLVAQYAQCSAENFELTHWAVSAAPCSQEDGRAFLFLLRAFGHAQVASRNCSIQMLSVEVSGGHLVLRSISHDISYFWFE